MRPFLQNQINEAIAAATQPLQQGLDAVAENAGVSLGSPLGSSAPSEPKGNERLDALRVAITGQNTPPPPMGWAMSNNRSARRLDALEPQVGQALVQVETLADVVKDGLEDIGAKFDLLNSQRQLDLSAALVERTRNDLQDAKDELQDAALQHLATEQALLAQQQQLTQAQTDLNTAKNTEQDARLAAVELKNIAQDAEDARQRLVDESQNAQAALTAAELEKVRLQQLADETKIEADRVAAANALAVATAAQATATQASQAAATADSKAVAAKAAAETAQAKADLTKQQLDALQLQVTSQQQALATTNQTLATQTARIDAVVANVATVQAAATAAQTTATNAQAAVAALGDKGRVLLNVATPASLGLLSNGGTISVPLTFKAFPDTSYTGSFIRTSGGTAAMGVSLSNRTTASCTMVLTYNGTLSLAIPAGTGDVVLTHS